MRKFVYSIQPARTFQQSVAGIYFDAVDEGEAQRKFAEWLYNDLGVWAFAHSVVRYEQECQAKKQV